MHVALTFRFAVVVTASLLGFSACSSSTSSTTPIHDAATTGSGGLTGTGGTTAGSGGVVGSGGTKAGTGGATASTSTLANFSFFVTSYAALQKIAGNTKGLGGDLRHGETGAGAGLRGADKICTAIAEASMPGNCKVWRAFLSTSTVTAISRVGSGPWYDRLGRVVSTNTAGLLGDRPTGANTTIINDLPNENGTPHEDEETSSSASDNHDILTGSTTQGTSYGATANCSDWTSSAASTSAKPRVGHSWSAMSGTNWISCLDESGCGPGYNLVQNGGPGFDGTVGSGGGYGAFYCLATTP